MESFRYIFVAQMEWLQQWTGGQFTIAEWGWLVFSGICIGMAKAGLSGLGLLAIPVLASMMGARDSTGFVLPLLIAGDIFGVIYYNRHANIALLLKLAPSTLIGLFGALFLGGSINDDQFRTLLGGVIILGVAVMIWRGIRRSPIPTTRLFAHTMGSLGGFTTMVGNAAGPVLSIYLLAMQLPKNNFIGTAAWFFLGVNLIKVPLQAFYWDTITLQTLKVNLMLVPIVVCSVLIGLVVVKYIPERPFKIFVIISVLMAALKMFF